MAANDSDTSANELLRTFLASRDAACPGCNYNVRDLAGDVCPECGQQLVLSLRLREPKQAALIAGLVGLSMGAGLGGLLLVYLLIVTLTYRRVGPPYTFAVVNTAGFIVHGLAIAAWVYYWNGIRRLSLARRIVLVGCCWLLPLVFVFVFAMAIR